MTHDECVRRRRGVQQKAGEKTGINGFTFSEEPTAEFMRQANLSRAEYRAAMNDDITARSSA